MANRTLSEIVSDLEPLLQRTLSSIRIEWSAGQASATFSFALYLDSTTGAALPQHTVEIDVAELPAGVSLIGRVRWPDLVRPLALEPDVETQIRDLDALGVVGRLDATRFAGGSAAVQAGYSPVSWIVKTHASSQAERADWIRSLRQVRPQEAAAALGVTRPRVYQLMAEGRLPYTTGANGHRLIRFGDLDLVRERVRTGRPPAPKA